MFFCTEQQGSRGKRQLGRLYFISSVWRNDLDAALYNGLRLVRAGFNPFFPVQPRCSGGSRDLGTGDVVSAELTRRQSWDRTT